MSKPTGTYSFLPYLRTGLANNIQQSDQDPMVKLRATFNLELTIEGQPVAGGDALKEALSQAVQLYGPGDLVGCEARAIFKTEPYNWITNFEPNYLPYVDFYDEDFPWRYTPNRPDDSLYRLTPWLALAVLEEGEFEDGKNIKELPFIRVENAASKFCPPEQLWAWAHVHVNRDLAASETEMFSTDMSAVLPKLESALKEDADLAYARILCPRKLKPGAAYHAFVIPSFESGRQAGLGLTVNPDFASQYAWGQKPEQTEFPYYYRWYFRTGTVGDFEYLVRLLKPRPADDRVGRRDMDVQEPGWNIDGLDPAGPLGGILKLGGALRVPKELIKDLNEFNKYENWAKDGYPQPIQKDIARFLNLADDYQKPGSNPQLIPDPDNLADPDPLITPPLYGRWHAAVNRLLSNVDGSELPNSTNWIHELNLDPRFRVPAGFGTKVIQDKQEEYMNAAWEQVGEVLKANYLIRLAQLSSEALWQWHTRNFQPLLTQQPDKLMLLSAPVQKRILVENATVFHQMKMSLVPPVAVSAQMRKIVRPRARAVKKLSFAAQKISPANFVSRLNAGELLPAPRKLTPAGMQTEKVLADNLQPKRWRLAQPQIFTETGETPAAIAKAPKSADFRISEPSEPFRPRAGTTDSDEALRFKTALKEMYAVDVAAREAAFQAPKQPLDLQRIPAETLAHLHPDRSIPRLVLDRILLPDRFRTKFVPELFDEVRNYPQFDFPMYKPLEKLSSEYFLPNINLIEQNSIILLETNQKFIESYMVGLNHEMSRELHWREYPTDLRGSYFRQFWDVSEYLPEQGKDLDKLKEKLKDIPELHHWSGVSNLGDHDNRELGGAKEEEVVLVIRGELLKKYPTAVIYAQKAKWQLKADGSGIDNTKERDLEDIPAGQEDNPPRNILKTPLYSAKIEPDIYFFGFDLTSEVAKGSDGTHPGDENKPGWFFVIKERPGEPRFGLDIGGPNAVKQTWGDLSWEDAAPGLPDNGFLEITNAPSGLSLSAPTDSTQAEFAEELEQHNEDVQIGWHKEADSADLAYILYQVPVLVAVHASEMLTIK